MLTVLAEAQKKQGNLKELMPFTCQIEIGDGPDGEPVDESAITNETERFENSKLDAEDTQRLDSDTTAEPSAFNTRDRKIVGSNFKVLELEAENEVLRL